MQCYLCEKPAIGQCPGCKRYYCKEHEDQLETTVKFGCSSCLERQKRSKILLLATLSRKYAQLSIDKRFMIAAVISAVFLLIALTAIVFYPDLEDRSGWAQVVIELVAFPLAIVGLYLTISEVAQARRRPILHLRRSIRSCNALSPAIRGSPPYHYMACRSNSENEFALDLILQNHGDQDAKYIMIDLVLYMPPQFHIFDWQFHPHREGGSLIQTEDWPRVEIRPEAPHLSDNRDNWTYGTGTEYHFAFNGGDDFVCYASDQVLLMTTHCRYDNPPTGIVNMKLSYKIRANNFAGSSRHQTAIAVYDEAHPPLSMRSPPIPDHYRRRIKKDNPQKS